MATDPTAEFQQLLSRRHDQRIAILIKRLSWNPSFVNPTFEQTSID